MAVAFGTNCWLGFGEESVYGTYVAPTKYLEITEESMQIEQSFISKPALSAASQSQKVRSKLSVSGSVKANLGFEGFERIFKHAFGSIVTTGPVSGLYTHTATLTNALPTGLSLHINRDAAQTGGQAYSYEGCQITSLTLNQDVEDLMTIEVGLLGEDSGLQTVATPTFPTFKQVDWEMPVLQLWAGAFQLKCKSFSITLENNLIEDRYRIGVRTRIGLGRSGPRKISGKFTVEHDSTGGIQTLWRTLQEASQATFIWDNGLSGTGNRQFAIIMNAALAGADPPVKDSGVVNVEYPFECWATAANNECTMAFLNATSSP